MREKSITENAAVVAFMTFISRIGGLIREMLLANYFGAGVVKSAFDVAYRIPNLFRRLFGEGALSGALIPIYTEILHTKGKKEADALASAVCGVVTFGLGVVSILGILLSYPLAIYLSAHFGEGNKWAAILPLLRIMLPYAPLICLAALIMGVLNSLKSFAISALAPAFQNLCCIIALLCVCPFIPAEGDLRIKVVSWSILVSGIVQVAVQIPALRRNGVPLRLAFFAFNTPGLKRVFTLMLPMALSAGVYQINVFCDSILAMHAGSWGPSVLGYSERIIYLPQAVCGTAFATVILPTLSTFFAQNDLANFKGSLEKTTRNVITFTMAATGGIIALAVPVVSVIYEWGAFDAQSTTRTANALIAYGAGLTAAAVHKIIINAFYAIKDSRTTMIVNTIVVVLNLGLNLFFIWILPPELKPVGIAIATSITSFLGCAALMVIMQHRTVDGKPLLELGSIIRVSLQTLVAAIIMGFAIYFANGYANTLLSSLMPAKLATILSLCLSVPLGVAIYAGIVRLICPSAWYDVLSELLSSRRFANRRKSTK